MTTQEKRFFRRELINQAIHGGLCGYFSISLYVYLWEIELYGQELSIY